MRKMALAAMALTLAITAACSAPFATGDRRLAATAPAPSAPSTAPLQSDLTAAAAAIAQAQTDLQTLTAALAAPAPTPTPTPTPATGLSLVVSGDMFSGDPNITVAVDGAEVGGTIDITAHHSLGQTLTVAIPRSFDPTQPHQVAITFGNDGWDGTPGVDGHDRNVYVGSVTLNGVTVQGPAFTSNTASTGKTDPSVAIMLTNGTVTYSVAAATPPAPGTPPTVAAGGGFGAAPSGPGFFVSPAGSDSSPGTSAQPFATLARAQQAMQAGALKATYVKAGTYTAALSLGSADNGETWQYDPASGPNTAILDGGNARQPIVISGGSNITINGLKVQHFPDYGIRILGGSAGAPAVGNAVINCDVAFNTVTSFQSAAIDAEGWVPGTLIANNFAHDVGSQGIALFDNWGGAGGTGNIDGSVISGNVVLHAVQRMSDGGAIYMEEHGGTQTSHTTIKSNFVRDYGAPGVTGQAGIYLDQGSNNVTITGNIVGPAAEGSVGTGNAGAIAFQDSTGFNNVFSGNIVDLGDSGRTLTVDFWYEAGTGPQNATGGNVFAGNIIVSGYSGAQATSFSGASGISYYQHPSYPTAPAIHDNLYFNYAGGQIRTDGNITGDSHPLFQNPQLSGALYQLAAASPVLAAPMRFPPIVGGWGPPGFVVPAGTAPSSGK